MQSTRYITTMLALVAAILVMSAFAEAATITLTPPTTRVDGSPLALDEIKHHEIDIQGPVSQTLIMTGTTQQWTPTTPGEYALKARTVDTGDRKSDYTDPTTYTLTITIQPPSKPGLTITLDTTTQVQAIDHNALLPGLDGQLWYQVVHAGEVALKAPAGSRSDDYVKNAGAVYSVNVPAGSYGLRIYNQATDGFSDSCWIEVNGGLINGGQPVFSGSENRGKWAYSSVILVDLVGGDNEIRVYVRESDYLFSHIELTLQ